MPNEMNKLIYAIIIFILLTSCKEKEQRPFSEFKVSDLRNVTEFPVLENDFKTIKVSSPTKKLKASDIIADFKYIPIETSTKSLMAYYADIKTYKNLIYIYDASLDLIFIFDEKGKYINTIGKKGNGPSEFILLSGMTINPYNDQVVVQDQMWKKLFYFTLKGDFLYTQKLPLSFSEDIHFLSPNKVAFSTNKTMDNTHLNDVDDYRVIFTDSLLDIKSVAFKYDDNKNGHYTPQAFCPNKQSILYNPLYSEDFYEVTDSSLALKYRIEYSDFPNAFDKNKILSLSDGSEMATYMQETDAQTLPPLLNTTNFLWFKTFMKDYTKEFYTYYDKNTHKAISFKDTELDFDTDFIFSSVTSVSEDYIIGYVSAERLINFKKQKELSKTKMSPEIATLIDNLQSDDNDVVVLFKLKSIQ